MPDLQYDLAIIGGGIVGLATALHAVSDLEGASVAVLEKEDAIARHQSGHNSGVIHSGIYYRPESLKARNCVAGAAAMTAFCAHHGVAYEICGKVVVATDPSQLPGLRELLRRGTENGVPGLEFVGSERLRELEPACQGVAALHVPGAGITDYAKVAGKYAELIEAGGGRILTGCQVTAISDRDAVILETTRGAISAGYVINCAGLFSDRIRKLCGDVDGPSIIPFRGEYYKLIPERQGLVRNLIYPVADPRFPFLGVHFTRHIEGFIEAGPNAVLALKREGYRAGDFDMRDALEIARFPGFWRLARRYWASGLGEEYRSFSKAAFTSALRKLLPELQESDLTPAGSGVRAQAVDRNGNLVDDFAILPAGRMIHVTNVPSPAATASLMIGRQLVDMAVQRFGLAQTHRAAGVTGG